MTTTIQRANQEFAERLSKLRHDIRTPVGHIIGYAEMIEEDLPPELLKSFSGDLQAIQNAGQRMLALVEDHLGATKETIEEINVSEAQFQFRLQLNHVNGYAEIIFEEAVETDNEELTSDLRHITAAARVALELADNIPGALLSRRCSDTPKPASIENGTVEREPALVTSQIGQGGEIIVVDDDPANRELLARRVKRMGYSAKTVASGEEALVLLETERFDLILLDYMMPGLSGLETLQKLKNSARLRTIPVIMLSASDDISKMVDCILHGAEDYIFKPFNPILLQARISACLEKVRLRQNVSRQFRLFISSPGDVIPERRVAKAVIGRLNEEFFGRAFLIPILWEEEPLLASETFQAQIHPPRETEIYVGILWSRIGSPLPESIVRPDGTRYESGTAFEFEDALEGFKDVGSPDMLIYRKQGAPTLSLQDRDMVLDRLDQIDRLNAYLDRWLIGEDGSYVGAFHNFETEDQLETMLELHLRKLVEARLSDGPAKERISGIVDEAGNTRTAD
ncbi:ATP-binding response regulator [Aliiruegeria sabulilitoris]|uniref:ATP-binding response regulator n=1 Tax=Aliiruegeria sabulilitoris TaxID=1510458 RepID=UPI000829A2F6|nr:response regulator [Aliiruegeria sabulilitoris]NDR55155.1 response regulator [Pseudoruegeria sp. M32A2M]